MLPEDVQERAVVAARDACEGVLTGLSSWRTAALTAAEVAYAAGVAAATFEADHVADMAAVADAARRNERERIVEWLRENYSPARMADRIAVGEHLAD